MKEQDHGWRIVYVFVLSMAFSLYVGYGLKKQIDKLRTDVDALKAQLSALQPKEPDNESK